MLAGRKLAELDKLLGEYVEASRKAAQVARKHGVSESMLTPFLNHVLEKRLSGLDADYDRENVAASWQLNAEATVAMLADLEAKDIPRADALRLLPLICRSPFDAGEENETEEAEL